MIKCGVFDSICGDARTALKEYLKARKEYKNLDNNCNTNCSFCHGSISGFDCLADLQEDVEDRGKNEHELLGTMVSVDPLADYIEVIEDEHTYPGERLMYKGERAVLGGIIVKVKKLVTKRGKNPGAEMCQIWVELPIHREERDYFNDEDIEGATKDESVQLVAFPDTYDRLKDKIEIGKPIIAEVEKLKDGLSLRNIFRLDVLKEIV
jgi:DNA polymerase III alpha subunit